LIFSGNVAGTIAAHMVLKCQKNNTEYIWQNPEELIKQRMMAAESVIDLEESRLKILFFFCSLEIHKGELKNKDLMI
jgi:hypothetical protein